MKNAWFSQFSLQMPIRRKQKKSNKITDEEVHHTMSNKFILLLLGKFKY